MNILVFSWRDPRHPLAGGAEQVMHEHMKGWMKAGHSVVLFSSRFKKSRVEEQIDGVQIIRAGSQYLGVQIAAFRFYQKNKDKYDLVVDQFHGLPFFTPLYVHKPKLAIIQETAREVWFMNPFPQPLRWFIGVLGFLGEPLIFLFYRNIAFMTGSESAKEDVAKFGIPVKNITVVPHGVITKKPRSNIKKENLFTVTFLGIITRDKGIEDALKCFAILSNKEEVQFWVIGRFETEVYKIKVMELLDKLNIKNRVKFWGFVDQTKKFELLKRSYLLINPSVREGWGLVNIEANSVSTPVVAYRSQGLVDSVKNGETGVICDNNIPEELAGEINKIISNPQFLKKLQEGAFKWSLNFSWEISVMKSLQLLGKIVK